MWASKNSESSSYSYRVDPNNSITLMIEQERNRVYPTDPWIINTILKPWLTGPRVNLMTQNQSIWRSANNLVTYLTGASLNNFSLPLSNFCTTPIDYKCPLFHNEEEENNWETHLHILICSQFTNKAILSMKAINFFSPNWQWILVFQL